MLASRFPDPVLKTFIPRAFIWPLAVFIAVALPAVGSAVAPSHAAVKNMHVAPADEIQASYGHLVNDYYKKVDPQILLNGGRDGLLAYLKIKHVKTPAVGQIHAGSTDAVNVRRLVDLLNMTSARYPNVSKTDLLYAELAGMAQSVHDRYTLFLTPQAKAMLNESLDGGNFSGVGLSIDVDPISKYLRVNEVIPAGPAMKSGVQDNDIITGIDGVSTKGLSTLADSKKLRGKVGTRVRLTILRNGKNLPAPITITRAVIHDPSVVSKMLPDHIGYIRLSVFGSTTAKELSGILHRLDEQGAQAFVLDLRDNGGGYLNAAVDVASNFVPSGGIVSVEDRGGSNTQFNAKETAMRLRPLAVLVNRSTASASEITSGAIQDHGVGVLVGTRTYGKGVVQTIFPLPDGSAIKITTQHYYTPRGRDINKVGIQPDIISTQIQKNRVKLGDPTNDVQLKTALKYVRDKIAANEALDK